MQPRKANQSSTSNIHISVLVFVIPAEADLTGAGKVVHKYQKDLFS